MRNAEKSEPSTEKSPKENPPAERPLTERPVLVEDRERPVAPDEEPKDADEKPTEQIMVMIPEDNDNESTPVMREPGREPLPELNSGRDASVLPEPVTPPPDVRQPPLPDNDNDPDKVSGVPDKKGPRSYPDKNGRPPELEPGPIEKIPVQEEPVSTEQNDGALQCKNGTTQPCYPPATDGCDVRTKQCMGICKLGSQLCVNGTWDSCVGFTGPGREACNKIDDNCNGMIDEGGRCP